MPPAAPPRSVAAEVMMLRQTSAAPFCLVEGPTDLRFWRSHVRVPATHVVACGGRAALLKALDQLATHGERRVIGVADRDGDDHLGPLRDVPGVVWTDGWDLEAMLLTRRTLAKLLNELADLTRVERFERANGPFWEALLGLGARWGALRVARKRAGGGEPSTTEHRVDACIDAESFTIRPDSALATDDASPLSGPPHRCAHGTDLLALLRRALAGIIGDATRAQRSADELAERLRLAFESQELHTTTTAEEIRALQRLRDGMVIL